MVASKGRERGKGGGRQGEREVKQVKGRSSMRQAPLLALGPFLPAPLFPLYLPILRPHLRIDRAVYGWPARAAEIRGENAHVAAICRRMDKILTCCKICTCHLITTTLLQHCSRSCSVKQQPNPWGTYGGQRHSIIMADCACDAGDSDICDGKGSGRRQREKREEHSLSPPQL